MIAMPRATTGLLTTSGYCLTSELHTESQLVNGVCSLSDCDVCLLKYGTHTCTNAYKSYATRQS